MIENILTGKVKQFFYEDVKNFPRDGSVTLLDVRTAGEYGRGLEAGNHCNCGNVRLTFDTFTDWITQMKWKCRG